jgi:hypothetical protein
MRIVTWNVYGLAGYPKDVSSAVIGTPGEDANCDHFATVFEQLDADIIAIQEGVTHRAAQNIARRCHRHLATFPSPQRMSNSGWFASISIPGTSNFGLGRETFCAIAWRRYWRVLRTPSFSATSIATCLSRSTSIFVNSTSSTPWSEPTGACN